MPDIAWGMATGAFSLHHRLYDLRTLTVVAFHRVLRRGDPCWDAALHERVPPGHLPQHTAIG